MIGHEPRLTETTKRHWVALCECGNWWSEPVIPARHPKTGAIRKAAKELAQAFALDAHERHVRDVRHDVERRSEMALASHGRLVEKVNDSTLQHRGRFGHP